MLLLPPSASAIFSRALNWWLLIGLISAKIKHGDAGEGGGLFFWHQYLTEKKVFVYSSLLVTPLAPQKNHKSDVRAARLLSINASFPLKKKKKLQKWHQSYEKAFDKEQGPRELGHLSLFS